MKKQLADGIVVSGQVSSKPQWVPGTEPDPLAKAVKRVQLPGVRPSFLGEANLSSCLFVPSRSRTNSWRWRMRFRRSRGLRMRVLGPAKMGPDGMNRRLGRRNHRDNVREARQDPRALRSMAQQPALIWPRCALTSQRTAESEAWLSTRRASMPRWRNAAIAWIGKPPAGTARIGTRQVNGKDQDEKLVIDTIDVDRDGIPDFSVWSGIEAAVASTETFWKAVFGNVAGRWVLLAFAQEADCT